MPLPQGQAADSNHGHETTLRLLQELQVHQIELESQNEELAQTREQMESALRHYRDLFELAPVGYINFDAAGCIGEINAAGADLLGVERRVLKGRPFADFVDPACRGGFRDLLARSFSRRGMQSAELTLGLADLRRKAVHLRVDVQVDMQGETARAVLVDISAERELETRLLVARDDAERTNQAKSAFVANMSHEIRTPLSAIIGLGHLLQAEITDPGQRRKLGQLCDTSEHLLAIINDILDFSKIESGELLVDRSEFRIDELVDRVIRLFGAQAQAKGLRLAACVSPDLQSQRLLGDSLRLAQVLINLVSNAVKFTAEGYVLVEVDALEDERGVLRVRFKVSDSGCGIEPSDQARLFEPFTQVDVSTTRRHGGTGLGLAISQRLVHMMGGRIDLSSQLGAGSSFAFELDLSVVVDDAVLGGDLAANVATGSIDFSGRRILVAEDHLLSREILFEMLKGLGCEVDAVCDGVEVVERARASSYDLVFMDLQMPRMDGVAAARAIRALPRGSETPIIALTANVFAEDRRRCLEAGMNSHLAKPVTPATLAAVLSRWIPLAARREPGAVSVDSGGDGPAQSLRDIAGLVIDPSWLASPESLQSYLSFLGRFVETKGAEMARCMELVEQGDHAGAASLVHAFKGAAAMIGALALAERAGELEVALSSSRAPASIGQLVSDCQNELRSLTQALIGSGAKTILRPADPNESPIVTVSRGMSA